MECVIVAQRRKRLAEADVSRAMELYGALPLKTDASLGSEVVWRLRALAEQHSLSAYDAAYLELAQRRGIGLATRDRRLAAAANDSGVKVFLQPPS